MLPRNRTWTAWAYALACLPIVLLLFGCLCGAYCDMQRVRTVALRSQMEQLQSECVHCAAGLKVLMDEHGEAGDSWDAMRDATWLRKYWSAVEPEPGRRPYVAIVDNAGTIVMHSDQRQVGQHLGRGWYERRVPEAGPDVVRVEEGSLSGDASAFDITVPLTVEGRRIGEYHSGLDAKWLDGVVAKQQHELLIRWSWMLGLVVLVDTSAVGGLIYLARREREENELLQQQARSRARELSQLGGGLAHEVRNPLHALRINLHTLRRAMGGRTPLGEDQLIAATRESDAAIDRIDGLLRDLLQFVDPAGENVADIDIEHELRASLGLLAEDLRRDQIEVDLSNCRQTALVSIDPTRLRQALLNLLTFAQSRAGKPGKIELAIAVQDRGVEVVITHGGPSLPADQAAHLFEPFNAPAETGSGLGLALVQVHIAAVGGRISCEPSVSEGNRIRLWLPVARST